MLLRKKIIGTAAYMGGLPANLEAFTWAWGQFVQFNNEYVADHSKGELVHLDKATVSLHDFARNSLVERFLGDWLFMTDMDHVFEPDILSRMLFLSNKFKLDAVTAIYRHRADPGCPVIYNWHEDGVTALPIGNWGADVQALRIGSAGGGSLLVKRWVYDKIRTELKEKPFTRFDGFGEDHAFFKRCQKLDIPVWALTKVESPHVIVDTLKMKDYDRADPKISVVRDAIGYS